jgi:hypothetical protein
VDFPTLGRPTRATTGVIKASFSRRQRLRVRRPGAGYSHYRTIKDA